MLEAYACVQTWRWFLYANGRIEDYKDEDGSVLEALRYFMKTDPTPRSSSQVEAFSINIKSIRIKSVKTGIVSSNPIYR